MTRLEINANAITELSAKNHLGMLYNSGSDLE